MSRAQMCFIARPALDGLADPHPHDRLGMVQKALHVVALPEVKEERAAPTTYSYSAPSSTSTDKGAEEALRRVCDDLASLGDGRYARAFSAAVYLGRFWRAGRLSADDIRGGMLQALGGLIKKRGERAVLRQIEGGLAASASHEPLWSRSSSPSPIAYHPPAAKPAPPTPPEPPPPPSDVDVINAEVARVVDEAILSANGGEVILLSVPVGCGKTRASLAAAPAIVGAGRAVIFSSPSYDLIEEAEQTLTAIDPSTPQQRLEGRLRGCRLSMVHEEGAAMVREEIAEGGRMPDLCERIGCPFLGSCDLAKRAGAVQRPDLGERVTFTPHAMISHLDRYTEKLPADPLIIIDESPAAAFFTTAEIEEIALIAIGEAEGDVEGWRRDHSEVVAWAAAVVEEIKRITEPRLRALKGHTEDIAPAALAAALDHLAPLAEAALVDVKPPIIDPYSPSTLPIMKARALRVLRHLAEMVANKAPVSAAVAFDDLGVRVEVGSALKLPQRGAVVVLDATPNIERWRLIAAGSGRVLKVIEPDPSRLIPHQAAGTWIRSTAYSRENMTRGGKLSARGAAALDNLGGSLQSLGLLSGSVGIGTHKAVADAIEDGRKGAGPLAAASISAWAEGRAAPVGYTGRDHRGSNKFENVETLIILGDPTTNTRGERRVFETLAIAAAGKLLAVSSEEASADRAAELEAYQTQWIGRARHQRRDGVHLVYCGSCRPPETAGIRWSEVNGPAAHRPRSEGRDVVERVAWAALLRGEPMTAAAIEEMGVSRQVARDIWTALIEQAQKLGGAAVKQGRSMVLTLPASAVQNMVLTASNKREESQEALSAENIWCSSKNHIPSPPPPSLDEQLPDGPAEGPAEDGLGEGGLGEGGLGEGPEAHPEEVIAAEGPEAHPEGPADLLLPFPHHSMVPAPQPRPPSPPPPRRRSISMVHLIALFA